MRFDITIVNILFALVSGALIIFYLRNNNIPYKNNRALLFVIIFGLINGLLSTKTATLGDIANTLKPIILIVCSVLIIKFMLELKLIKSFVVFLMLFIGMGIGNAAGFLILMPFVKGYAVEEITTNIFLYSASNFIAASITILFLYIIKPINRMIRQIINNKVLLFALIFTLIIISANSGLHFYIKVFNITAYLIITIMSFVYCAYAIFNSTVIYRRQIERTEKEQQDFYNKSLEGTLFNLSRFKHDWGNTLAVLNSMAAMGKLDEIKTYLKEITEYNAKNNDTSLLNIKNAGLFGIISSKKNRASEMGIDINIWGTGEISAIPGIKISELCEVVGIFLDNALEEAAASKENIELKYADTDKAMEISIINKCNRDIDLSKLGKESTKGEERGNGLKIVEQIIGKYKNIQNYRSYDKDDKTFEQLIVIEKGL